MSRVARLFVPLGASWLLMAAEQPLLTAVIARMADQKVQLAAWGAVVFPVALVIEAPIIMLLAASTALCGDRRSYLQVRRFMLVAGAALTALHVLVAFTPLFDLLTRHVLHTPAAAVEPARVGLMLMTPWTWAIAYRRFQQGVLIRFERGRAVTAGTLVRLASVTGTLAIGFHATDWPGAAVAAAAISVGVVAEAAYSGWCVRSVLHRLRPAPTPGAHLDLRRFLGFYLPLAMTPLVMLLVQPLGAAAMGRMPNAIDSLAAWAPLYGLVFVARSVGMGYNEAVVSLIGERGSLPALRRFNRILMLATTGSLLVVAVTPLAGLWFGHVQHLAPDLEQLARLGLLLCIPMPAYQVLQSFYQGALVASRRTAPLTEAVVVYGVVATLMCGLGVALHPTTGLVWALISFVTAGCCQTAWLWLRSRGVLREFAAH